MPLPERSITFDRAVAFYDDTRGFPPGIDMDAAELMVRAGGVTRQSVMVEIGVGTGRLALPLAQHSGPYLGVDLSAAMMEVLQGKRSRYPGGDLRLIRGDVMNLPLQSASADFAVLVHILHLVPDPQAAVRELARVLKPGGAAIAGWNRTSEPALQPLKDAWHSVTEGAWSSVTGDNKQREDADEGPLQLAEAGWKLRTQDALSYTTFTTAHKNAEAVRGRIFSRMWRLPDDVWRAGVAAVEKALVEHYPDPHAPQRVEHTFYVAVYDKP